MKPRTLHSHLPQAELGEQGWVRGQSLSRDEARPRESGAVCLHLALCNLQHRPLTPALSPKDFVVGGEGVIRFDCLCS